jgi:hypothetical protein
MEILVCGVTERVIHECLMNQLGRPFVEVSKRIIGYLVIGKNFSLFLRTVFHLPEDFRIVHDYLDHLADFQRVIREKVQAVSSQVMGCATVIRSNIGEVVGVAIASSIVWCGAWPKSNISLQLKS